MSDQNRTRAIGNIIDQHLLSDPDGTFRNSEEVGGLIVSFLAPGEEAVTQRERDLMLALWCVVRAQKGRIRVPKSISAQYVEGVSILDSRLCPITGAMIYEVKA